MAGGRIDIDIAPDLREFPAKLASGLKGSSGVASAGGRALGLVIAGAAIGAAAGLREVVQIGNEYSGALNEIQAVSGATGLQMEIVGNKARELGSDLTLPATSGADAAKVMLELTKGGLSLADSMEAARGTIQLAAAAQIEGAAAAEIQSNTLNQFGLAATDASHVADVLANTANAASGSITDIALALKYVGPIADTVQVSLDDTATTIGLLANRGIQADNAGTALRGMLVSLASPSKEAAKGLDALGISAFDQEGRFVGLRSVIDQLSSAQARMTDEQFTSAAATAFGREPLAAITALAAAGAPAFDDMASAVGRQGGAADVAAAKTQGLGGALDKLQSQAEDAALGIYDAVAPNLEKLVLAAADKTAQVGDAVAKGLQTGIAAAEVYGPRLAAAISARADVVQAAVRDLLGPLVSGSAEPINQLVNTSIEAFDDLTGTLDNVVKAAKPVASGIGEVAEASGQGAGAVGALGAGVGLLGGAVQAVSAVLVPVGSLIGGLVSGFSELPGPVQTAALALVAYKIAQRSLADTNVLSGVRQFSGEMAVQRGLAAANGTEVSRLGSVMAAYRTSTVPAVEATRNFTDQVSAVRAGAAAAGQPIGVMSAAIGTLVERSSALSQVRTAFETASSGAERFGTVAGVAAAGATGLRLAAGGLVSALGGPVGIAIAAVSVGLSLLGGSQEKAAATTQKHASAVDSLVAALKESNGAITEQVRLSVAQRFLGDEYKNAAAAAKTFGISMSDVTDAALKQGTAYDTLKAKLEAIVKAGTTKGEGFGISVKNEDAEKAQALLDALKELAGTTGDAIEKQKQLDAAIRSGNASLLDGTESGRSMAEAMKTLSSTTASADDKTRALKSAIDALNGGTVNLEAAQSRVNEQVSRLADLFGENIDKTKGWGEALLNANGSINTTLPNGRALFDTLQDLSSSSAEVAQRTFEISRANGEDVPTAMAKAAGAIQTTRDALISQAEKWGLNGDAVAGVLDRYGLVPSEVATLISQPGMSSAQLELLLLKAKADDVPNTKSIVVSTLSAEAVRLLDEVGFKVRDVPGGKEIVMQGNDSDFNAVLARALAPATKTITIQYFDTGVPIAARGQAQAALNAIGGITVAAYAAGGMHKLTPMSNRLAQVVPPNTWRVMGDRVRDDEFFIPDNDDPRSIALMKEFARRRGFALARLYAEGGVASRTAAAPTVAVAGAGGQMTGVLLLDSGEVLGKFRGVVTSELDKAGSAINRRKRV